MTDTISRFFPRPKVANEGHRVTTFELLFDLVFVFAFTQVTEFMAEAHSPLGVLQALMILSLLWWGWSSYAWLSNQTHVDEGVMRLGMTISMVAMFVLALVVPEAFHDLEGGLYGPVVLVIAYAVVRVIHIALYLIAAGEDRALRRQVLRTSSAMIVSFALLTAGALIPAWQVALWVAAIIADIVLTYLTSTEGSWRLQSAAHWAERHGLVIILALGESIVSIGVGAAHEAISVPILLGSILAILLTVSLWWLYFDVTAIAAEHNLAEQKGVARAQMATDAYTYLHLLLISGIVISALGVEGVIAHAADGEALGLFGACALFGGPSLYLAGHAFFWKRVGGTFKVWRLAGGTLLLALIPVGMQLQPVVALGIVVAICVAVAATETRRYAEKRAKIRENRA